MTKLKREYYYSSIEDFINNDLNSVLGQLLINDEFETTDLQKNSWRKEIEILQNQLLSVPNGEIALEYTIPRIGHRVDAVIIINGIIFLLEFKVGDKDYR